MENVGGMRALGIFMCCLIGIVNSEGSVMDSALLTEDKNLTSKSCPFSGKFLYKDTRCWVTHTLQSPHAAGEGSFCHVTTGPERGLFKCKRGNWVLAGKNDDANPARKRAKRFLWGRRRRSSSSGSRPPPNRAPYFSSCPGNIVRTAPSNQKTAAVTWTARAVDPEGSVTLRQTQGLAPGSRFPEGDTAVAYTASDSAGLTAKCAFKVTIRVTRCPYVSQLSHFADGSQSCSGVEKNIHGSVCHHSCGVGHVLHGARDVTCLPSGSWSSAFPSCQPVSCGAPGTVAGGQVLCPQGHVFPRTCTAQCLDGFHNTGTTSVTCQSSGHWSDQLTPCTDVESPTFPNGCPADIHLFSGPLETPVPVTWVDPIARDNSGHVASLTPDLARGSKLGVGSHRVRVTASDAAGNEASCSFLVTVRARTCSSLAAPPDGHVTCTSGDVEGSECTVTCDVGFRLKGSAKLTCLNTELWNSPLPLCEAIICPSPPPIHHGVFACPGGHQNPAVCTLTCETGFVVQSPADIRCQENATWSSAGSCLDVTAPQFTNGCPADVQIYGSALGSVTRAQWPDPDVTDNSNEPLDLRSDVMSNASFPVGQTVVTYTARDTTGNSATCQFVVNVTALYCPAPNIDHSDVNSTTNQSLLVYSCPDGYAYGARCTVDCAQGYRLVGERGIECARRHGTYPPLMAWEWALGASGKPQCREDQCPPLAPPKNGALSCNLGSLGWDCLMTCQESWDIPLNTSGHVYCVNALRTWVPASSVPDCVVRVLPGRVRMQTSLFYFVGSCNASLDALRHDYVTRMSSSVFKDACVNVPSCSASNVEVTCGPTSAYRLRRNAHSGEKRDAEFMRKIRAARHWTRDASSRHLVVVSMEIHMPYEEQSASPEEAYQSYMRTQKLLRQRLLKEVRRGRMDVGGLVAEGSGVGATSVRVDCPPGTLLRPDHHTLGRFSCVGCPGDQYLPVTGTKCVECVRGQNSEGDHSTPCIV